MQIQIQGLLQYAVPLFPTAEVQQGGEQGIPIPPAAPQSCLTPLFPQKDLLGVQQLLNSSETGLHQLTALLDCRGLHKVRGGSLGASSGVPLQCHQRCPRCPVPPGLPGRPHRDLLRWLGGAALPGALLSAGGRRLLHGDQRCPPRLEAAGRAVGEPRAPCPHLGHPGSECQPLVPPAGSGTTMTWTRRTRSTPRLGAWPRIGHHGGTCAASAATAAAWAARAACTPRHRPCPTPPSPSTCETPSPPATLRELRGDRG